jgi:cyclohexanone monooxygenase
MPFDRSALAPDSLLDTPDHEVLIIGSGFSGLGTAIRLAQTGFDDFAILEKENEVGGTWYINTYPGCACDVFSHVYSFSFEPNPDWSRAYSKQPEILQYLKNCADKYDIRRRVRFGAQVVQARFDEAAALWRVFYADASAMHRYMQARGLLAGDAIDLGDAALPPLRQLSARVLVSGMGPLSTPAYPALPGLERFMGKTFHSQQWDHDYDLAGKRVAVIGTGASAIQFVPEIQPQVAQLDLYQRTPPWILPKPDRAMTHRERWMFRHVPGARALERTRLYWMLESAALAFTFKPQLAARMQRMALDYMKRKLPDPALRAKLTPDYAMGCKRVLFSRNYLPALSQPNVAVIADRIGEVREQSIVDAHGVERPVDAIIFGTGFRVVDPVPRGAILGRGGRDLIDVWQGEPQAYKGTTVAGFPNLFLLVGPNVGLGHNSIVFMIESQINYLVDALRLMKRKRLATIEVKPEVQARFNDWIQRRSQRTVWVSGGCRSYYLHPETDRNFSIWPSFTFAFRRITRRFDARAYRLQTLHTPQRAQARGVSA